MVIDSETGSGEQAEEVTDSRSCSREQAKVVVNGKSCSSQTRSATRAVEELCTRKKRFIMH